MATDRKHQPTVNTCNLCGQGFVGPPGSPQCKRCHGDYRVVRIAEHTFRAGWRAACEAAGVDVGEDALRDAVAGLNKRAR